MTDNTTVCILSYMRIDKLAACLGSIWEADDRCKVVVLDSSPAATQKQAAAVAATYGATFIGWPEPVTCNYGRREILNYVDTDWVVYLDDDMTVPDKWLTKLHADATEHNADVAVMCWYDQQTETLYSGGRGYRNGFTTMATTDHVGPVSFCAGGATLYRTEMLRKTRFDVRYDGCGEDHDQTIQLAHMGATIIQSGVVCDHWHEDNDGEFKQQRFRDADIIESQVTLGLEHGLIHQLMNALARAKQSSTPLNADSKRHIAKGIMKWISE